MIVPEENVATPQHDAVTVEGQVKDALLNGDTENYNGEQGYTTHAIMRDSSKGITVRLGQPFLLNCIRMLLWDRDNRSYSYYVQVGLFVCVCVCVGPVGVVVYFCCVLSGISGPGALGNSRGPLRASVSILAGIVFRTQSSQVSRESHH